MSEAPFTLLFSDEVLFDRQEVRKQMPTATALVMASRYGGSIHSWAEAYHQILNDWESYWIDLNVDSEDSLEQWREGRWRVVRALFRLTGRPLPGEEDISLHLDIVPRETGRKCTTWLPGAVEGLQGLSNEGVRVSILSPSLPAPLFWGMADAAGLDAVINTVVGPDELGQVGLFGIQWERLELLAKAEPGYCLLVHPTRQPPIKAPTLRPPADLSRLPGLTTRFGGL